MGWEWDESYTNDGYGYEDVGMYSSMRMGIGCLNPVKNSTLTHLIPFLVIHMSHGLKEIGKKLRIILIYYRLKLF
jgi:hypothetical protein